jgi:hypothetical protein
MSEFLNEDRVRLIVWEEINNHFVDEKSCKERHEREKSVIDELKATVDKQSAKLDKIIVLLITACVGLVFDLLFRLIGK